MNIRTWTPRPEDSGDNKSKYNNPFREVEKKKIDDGKQFRYAFVLKPGFNFVPLGPYCEEIVFATDGYAETVEEQWNQLKVSLLSFDVDKDVLIPIGSASLCSMAATVLVRLILNSGRKNWDSYTMGVYKDGDYQFWRVPTILREEAYYILMR